MLIWLARRIGFLSFVVMFTLSGYSVANSVTFVGGDQAKVATPELMVPVLPAKNAWSPVYSGERLLAFYQPIPGLKFPLNNAVAYISVTPEWEGINLTYPVYQDSLKLIWDANLDLNPRVILDGTGLLIVRQVAHHPEIRQRQTMAKLTGFGLMSKKLVIFQLNGEFEDSAMLEWGAQALERWMRATLELQPNTEITP